MCVLESPFTPALMSRRITAYTPNYILYGPTLDRLMLAVDRLLAILRHLEQRLFNLGRYIDRCIGLCEG